MCGHLDWRMPNIRELESLVDLCADSPALAPDHPFGNVREVYWSSTTSVYEPVTPGLSTLVTAWSGSASNPTPYFTSGRCVAES